MISVIVPCKNRLDKLEECLNSIKVSIEVAKRDIKDLESEIIVINDHSEEGFKEKVLEKFKEVKVEDSTGVGPGYARNFGISISKGEYIFFTDSDCVVSEDWILKGYNKFVDTQAIVIQGVPWLFQENTNPTYGINEGKLYKLLFTTYLKGVYTSMTDSRNLLINRKITDIMGREVFSEKSSKATAESRVFGKRCISHGIEILFDENIKIYHEDPDTMLGVCKQKYRHGSGRVEIWKERPKYEDLKNRYFDGPIKNGIDKDYVLPAHFCFLLGYYKNIEDKEEYEKFIKFAAGVFKSYERKIEDYKEISELI